MRILVIDDSPDDRELIVRSLKRATSLPDLSLVQAESGSEGLDLLETGGFDCVLMDFSMPGLDGLEIVNNVRLRFPELAMVMITGSGNERIAVEALKGGASDYVQKSEITTAVLERAISQACSIKEREGDILRSANFDELTGLPNRRALNERLDYLQRRGERHSLSFGIAFMDLDGLKRVNDSLGHEIGDLLLKEAAARLKGCLRSNDLLVRLGGDEFVAILEDLGPGDRTMPQVIVDRFVEAIDNRPFDLNGQTVDAGISIGLALYPQMAEKRDDLLRLADEAMYANKAARKQAAGRAPGDR